MTLLALTVNEMLPLIVFVIFMAGAWGAMTLLSREKSHAEERLDRLGRSRSSGDMDMGGVDE